jgi:hypothetical protein
LGEDSQGDKPEEQDKHNTVQKHDGRRQAALRLQAIQQPYNNFATLRHYSVCYLQTSFIHHVQVHWLLELRSF